MGLQQFFLAFMYFQQLNLYPITLTITAVVKPYFCIVVVLFIFTFGMETNVGVVTSLPIRVRVRARVRARVRVVGVVTSLDVVNVAARVICPPQQSALSGTMHHDHTALSALRLLSQQGANTCWY